jgi:hypothetical protein
VIKSVFFTNQRVLEVHPFGWLIDRFFLETVGIEYANLSGAAQDTAALPLNIERKLSRVRNNMPFFARIPHNPLPDVAQPHSIRVVQSTPPPQIPSAVFVRVAGIV